MGKLNRTASVPKVTDRPEDHQERRVKWHLDFTGHLPEQLWSLHLAGVDNGTVISRVVDSNRECVVKSQLTGSLPMRIILPRHILL